MNPLRVKKNVISMLCVMAVLPLTGCKKTGSQNAQVASSATLKPSSSFASLSQEQSCSAFTQDFYNWYVSVGHQQHNDKAAAEILVEQKPDVLGGALLKALKEDFEVQRRSEGEIAGIDFDPFLNSQDPSSRFIVENVVVKNGDCLATVRGVESGQKYERVTPELMWVGALWKIENVHYEKSQSAVNENLLSLLTSLRNSRKKH